MNDYFFNLDSVSHSGAHYSKNWDKKKQSDYNKWYYKTHKDKFDKKSDLDKEAKKYDKISNEHKNKAESYKESADRFQSDATRHGQNADEFKRDSRKPWAWGNLSNENDFSKRAEKEKKRSDKSKAISDSQRARQNKEQYISDTAKRNANSRRKKSKQIEKEIKKDKNSFSTHVDYGKYKIKETANSVVNKGKKAISKLFG